MWTGGRISKTEFRPNTCEYIGLGSDPLTRMGEKRPLVAIFRVCSNKGIPQLVSLDANEVGALCAKDKSYETHLKHGSRFDDTSLKAAYLDFAMDWFKPEPMPWLRNERKAAATPKLRLVQPEAGAGPRLASVA